MFRALFVNTFISALSFFVVSVIGLLLIPLLVGTYGITQYGMLVLARLFLPTGLLGVFDFGFAEAATQAVARARVNKDWNRAAAQVTLLVILAALVSAVLALVLNCGSDILVRLLKIEVLQRKEFKVVLQVTGGILVVAFPCLVFEGVIKGYEAFRQLRMCEVTGTIAYAILATFAVWFGLSFAAVAYAYLGGVAIRALAAFAFAIRLSRPDLGPVLSWDSADKREVFAWCRLMAVNKLLGTAQAHVSSILIGVLLNAAAVGAYDVIVRLPRFAKSILGLLNVAVLPVATRLEAASDCAQLSRLNRVGLVCIAAVSLPPLAAGVVFSEDLLRWWIGESLSQYWIWQSAMFAVPALSALVGYGATSLLTRPRAVSVMNRLVFAQLTIQLLLALPLVGLWQERAFIFGQVAAMGMTFVLQMRVIGREHNLNLADLRPLIVGATLIGVLLGASFAMNVQRLVIGPLTLMAGIASWCALAWLLVFFFMFSVNQRQQFFRSAKAMVVAGRGRE